MISIVIATYNREKTILRAIYSILNQKFDAYEIVIVDDGSKDNTKQIIENLNNEKIKYFYIEN
ncbi:MAG: glycosyltransferase family 2 protein [Phascolarctobacterium sp.]|nr:glycosyltransferase family 2 protein [Phascolarctobacterium sp.]MUU16335.1 glycosyltransferase family 2 protein [Phascolarctobacterium sp.]